MAEHQFEQPESREDQIEGLLEVGRFNVFDGFETGVTLSCEADNGQEAVISLLPSEALALATLIENHRSQLEDAVAVGGESSVTSSAVTLSTPGNGPEPIPFYPHPPAN